MIKEQYVYRTPRELQKLVNFFKLRKGRLTSKFFFSTQSLFPPPLKETVRDFRIEPVLPTLFKIFGPDIQKNSAARKKIQPHMETCFLEEIIS
jgi:hypothetical protein